MKIYWNPLFNFDFENRKRLVIFACRPGMGVGMGGGWGGRGGVAKLRTIFKCNF